MSWRGFLLRAGIEWDNGHVSLVNGLGINAQDAQVLHTARISTSTVSGSSIEIDATSFQWSEAFELRYHISDWADTYTLTEFKGIYLRVENREANASGSVYGAQVYGVSNAVDISNVWGALFYGYLKGSAAVAADRVYGIQTEFTMDAGGSADTISVEATPILSKITCGTLSDYTVVHGMIVRLGDMNGSSTTFGSGIKIEDDSDMSGTCGLTVGLNITAPATTGIVLAGAMTDGLLISGACGDNGIEISGACTDSAIQIVTGTFGNGLFINADGTTAINISSNFTGTTGILMAGTSTTAFSITGAFTTGISVAADGTTGIEITSAFSGTTGLSIAGTTTNAISISGTPSGADIVLHNGATIMNGSADELTITEPTITLAGSTKINLDGAVDVSGAIVLDAAFTTGISIAADGTTGLEITSAFSGTTGISFAGTATDGLKISGVCTDAIEISGAATANGINVSADCVTGLAIAAQTTTGISLAGAATCLQFTGTYSGNVIKVGASGSPLVNDSAIDGFIVGYFDSGDTTGWPAGLYITTNVTEAGGSFTALQGDAVLTAAKATVTGIENFMQVSTGGRVTGACRSVQGTIDFSDEDKGSGGCYSAACFNIKGEGSSVDIGTTQRVACIELKTEGTFSSNAGENFQSKTAGYAIYINGFTAASGGVVNNDALTWTDALASVIGLKVGVGSDGASGDIYYIPLIPAAEWN